MSAQQPQLDEFKKNIRTKVSFIIDHIASNFFLSHNRDSNNTKRKFKDNYYFCHKLRQIVDICFNDIANIEECFKIESIVGNEDIIDDEKFFEIILNIFLIIKGMYGGFMLVLLNINNYFFKNPPEYTKYTPQDSLSIADPISILDDDTPHSAFSGNIPPEKVSDYLRNNYIVLQEITQNYLEFKTYFHNLLIFFDFIKKLINIDNEIISCIEMGDISNMKQQKKIETRVIIIDIFKSQLEILIKLLCTTRTKIDIQYIPERMPPSAILERKPKPPFMLPTRIPTRRIGDDYSISSIVRSTLEEITGPIGFRPMGKGHQSGGFNFEKIIYKQYKYLYLILKYVDH